jgi:hypothetical protein
MNSNGDASTRTNRNSLSMVTINAVEKHRLKNKFKTMLALGGKKAGKGKGLYDETKYRKEKEHSKRFLYRKSSSLKS